MAATEIYTNNATTTVTSGGATAGTSGTVESWGVTSSATFPTASAGVTQFHVGDPAQPSELIAVTAVAGTAWTVTRGAESTTPVSHAPGFTVDQVITAGGLNGLLSGAGGPLTVGSGGTGGTKATAYSVIAGGTSATAPFQQIASVGTAGQGLVSNGAGSLPSFQNVVNSVTAANATITVGGTSLAPTVFSIATPQQAARFTSVSGQFPRETVPWYCASNANTFTSGVMYCALLPVVPGDVITNLGLAVGNTAVGFGTSPHWWMALYTAGGVLIAQTADQTNTGLAGSTQYQFPLGSGAPYTVPAATYALYAGVMINVGAGGTMPTLRGPALNAAVITIPAAGALVANGSNGSSLGGTAPSGSPTPITLVASASYAYIMAN